MKCVFKIFAFFLIFSGCGEEIIEESLIESSGECLNCHSWSNLSTPPEDLFLSPKEHMLKYGNGVITYLSYDPAEKYSFSAGWIKRGNHGEEDKNRCSECHYSGDLSHGGYFYPPGAQSVFYKGDCSFSCHRWIEQSFNPSNLLDGCTGNAHQKIYRDGYMDEKSSLKISDVKSGCGGCHSIIEVKHGSIPDCLSCHKFKGPIHSFHEERWGGNNSCGFCHDGYGGDTFRASCYNCHKSGHCPE